MKIEFDFRWDGKNYFLEYLPKAILIEEKSMSRFLDSLWEEFEKKFDREVLHIHVKKDEEKVVVYFWPRRSK